LIGVIVGFSAAGAEIVAYQAGAGGIILQPLIHFEHGVLTVATPDGTVFRQEFGAGQSVVFSPFGHAGYNPPDGAYVWEVWLGQPSAVHPKLHAAARANRESGDVDVEVAHRVALSRATQVQSGTFQIVGGTIVPSTLVEPGSGSRGSRNRSEVPNPFRLAQWLPDDPSIQPVDQVIPDDLIVQGSLCVGLDCVNNESFGFDTIRMKENNTRIKFEDTSVGTFPTNDWELTANESASGGASKFSITDITGSRVPFTITAGAATNSIFVDSTGRVGLRTATPVLDLHINTSNTPATRLEQNNSGGFTAQTWDVAGNEANFFVRDVTGGSRLPFRIRPGAPTSSIDINASGKVGIGTASPDEKLHVDENANAATIAQVKNTNLGTSTVAVLRAQSDVANGTFQSHASTRVISHFGQTVGGWSELLNIACIGLIVGSIGATPLILGTNNANRIHVTSGGNVGIGTAAPANPLQMASGALVTAGGVWTNASSRALKQDIRELTAQEAHGALGQLAPVRYTSTADPTEHHVGFIAEDVPDLVATTDRKALSPMDIVAVLTRVVQEQQKTVEAQQKTIAELAAKIQALEAARPR
jgi:hypothetical protein